EMEEEMQEVMEAQHPGPRVRLPGSSVGNIYTFESAWNLEPEDRVSMSHWGPPDVHLTLNHSCVETPGIAAGPQDHVCGPNPSGGRGRRLAIGGQPPKLSKTLSNLARLRLKIKNKKG
ncbi:hypothetical protein H1C71_042467, partial [Ictidomys tridecemlineatus]